MKKHLLVIFCCLLWFSCNKVTHNPPSEEEGLPELPKVFVVFPPNGVGDNGYLDNVLNAATIYMTSNPGELYVVLPRDSSEASNAYESIDLIVASESPQDSVLSVFIGSEYRELLFASEPPKGKHKVLLLEDDGKGAPEWLNTCYINRYGISYLAGAMVSQQPASVIAAMPGETTLEMSIDGFCKGYEGTSGKEVESIYFLSEGYDGFEMQANARKLTDSIMMANKNSYHTVYPLAGASNQGVYNALLPGPFQVIGMDRDYSGISEQIPFSVYVAVDSLMLDCLNKWRSGQGIPKRRSEGIESKYLNLVFNSSWDPAFYGNWNSDQGGNVSEAFWKERYEQFFDQAIKEEREYEKL